MRHTHPIYVRPLSESEEERAVLRDSLRSSDAFVLRRAQIVLASAAGEHATQIAPHVGLTGQSVRDVIHAFNERGLDVLARRSQASPVVVSSFDTAGVQALRDLLHQSPRLYGKDASLWTLEVAADVAYERGLTATRVSGATIHNTLARMGVRWRRAKGWITGPDPEYAREKASRDRLIRMAPAHPDWLLGFEDEVWWSRLAHPALRAWADDDRPPRLVEQAVTRDDPDPKAVACYGLLTRAWDSARQRREDRLPLLVRPAGADPGQARRPARLGQRLLARLADRPALAPGAQPRGQADRRPSARLLVKSPWLNPIEPKWPHGKRKVLEPDRLLSAADLVERVCSAFGCPHEPHLISPPRTSKKAA